MSNQTEQLTGQQLADQLAERWDREISRIGVREFISITTDFYLNTTGHKPRDEADIQWVVWADDPDQYIALRSDGLLTIWVSGDDQTYDSAIWIDDDQIEELERLVAEMRDDYNRSIEPTELGQMRCGYYHGPNYPH